MPSSDPDELLRSAAATRREAFAGPAAERDARLAQAHALLTRAVAVLRSGSAPPIDLAQALHRLADVDVDRGHTNRARGLWEEAIPLLREADAPLRLAHALRHLGDLHRRADDLDAAAPLYDEALALQRAHAEGAHDLDLANTLRPAALLDEHRGESDRALARWREARAHYAAAGVDEGVAEADAHIRELGGAA